MRIAIYGVGGVGGYYGGRLAEAGHDVVFIARGEHLTAMQRDGLRVFSPVGDFVIKPVTATNNPGQAGVVDVVIVAVKAWHLAAAAEAIKPMVGKDSLVLPLQNGVDATSVLASVLGDDHVLGGSCGISAYIEGPGCIRHVAVAPYIQFGPVGRTSPTQVRSRIEDLRHAFAKAKGVAAEIPEDMLAALWQKFLGVAPTGAIGAITRAPMGVTRADASTRHLVESAKREIWYVGRAMGVKWAPDAISRVTAVHDAVPFGTTASMQRDIMAGRPSELDAQIGVIVRLGESLGVPTPVNKFILDCLMPQERRARGEVSF
jgi:2-dehydropantoate 2-reductase